MIEWLDNLEQLIQASPWLAVLAVFLGGALTSLNPCVLVTIPMMMGFVASRKDQGGALRGLAYSGMFLLGMSLIFAVLGAIAALAGSLFGEVPVVWTWIVVGVCMVMGLHLLGLVRIPLPKPLQLQPVMGGALGAFVLGLLFGAVCTPCAAPILVVVLAYLASAGASVAYGALLLVVYSIGHSLLILLAGTSMGFSRKLLQSKGFHRAGKILHKVAGVVILLIGTWFVYTALR